MADVSVAWMSFISPSLCTYIKSAGNIWYQVPRVTTSVHTLTEGSLRYFETRAYPKQIIWRSIKVQGNAASQKYNSVED